MIRLYLPFGILLSIFVALSVWVSPAGALTARAGWTISSLAEPTDFSPNQNRSCEEEGVGQRGRYCDSYELTATNTGSRATNGEPVTVTDTLPRGLRVQGVATRTLLGGGKVFEEEGFEFESEEGFGCTHTLSNVTCEYKGILPSGDFLLIAIDVLVEPSTGSGEQRAVNTATVAGGGAPASTTTSANVVNPNTATAFGIQEFNMGDYGIDGAQDLQAGDHPYAVTSSFALNSIFKTVKPHGSHEGSIGFYEPAEEVKDVVVYLPLGLVGDPLATPRCSEAELEGEDPGLSVSTKCPTDSRIGTITISDGGVYASSLSERSTFTSSIYNVEPERGYPAELGFFYISAAVVMYAEIVPASAVVPSATGYLLRVSIPDIVRPDLKTMDGASLTIFGDPAEHDRNEKGEQAASSSAFFSNPADCTAGPLTAKMEADSWGAPGHYVTKEATMYPQVTGCNLLQFDPRIEARPETTQADEPAGYTIDLSIPQATNVFPVLATPELENATVTLPEGVSISPSAADGLKGCQETGDEGINMSGPESIEIGDGNRDGSPYDDGMSHVAHGHCPQASEIGTAQILTPLLPKPMEGGVYLVQPRCGGERQPPCTQTDATDGGLFGLYLEVEGSGVIVKLKGAISVNPDTGQLTTHFDETPQFPVSEIKLQLKGSPRAPLANPLACGVARTDSDLTPWSSPQSSDSTPSAEFTVSGCEGSPFNPGFLAQTQTAAAGTFSSFVFTLTRKDREQDLAGLQVTLPPGLIAMLSSVTPCGVPEAAQGSCSQASEIGTATVASGPGSHPLWLTGRVYLTQGYRGAPFGLTVVVPAQAGPFNLGNVVIRAAIDVDPHTSAVTITSDPFPQIIDGIPLRIQTVNVAASRPGFMLNPTNCKAQHITATIASAEGTMASVGSPFAVEGCKKLLFKPSFTIFTQGAARANRNGASLDIKVAQKRGEANISQVLVSLPKQLPSRLSTINEACPDTVFNVNPAACPSASDVGIATASTPVLPVKLAGPVYLVSHGNVAFPNLEVILQGDGVQAILQGSIKISEEGTISSAFRNIPDIPISSFELNLPEGPHSVLSSPGGNLCGKKLAIPAQITAQSGVLIKRSTKIQVVGCRETVRKSRSGARKRNRRKRGTR